MAKSLILCFFNTSLMKLLLCSRLMGIFVVFRRYFEIVELTAFNPKKISLLLMKAANCFNSSYLSNIRVSPFKITISIIFLPIPNNREQMHCFYQNYKKQTSDLPCVSVNIERLRDFRQEIITHF